MAVSFQSAEFASAAALSLFVRNNSAITASAGWAIVPLSSGTYQVFGTLDPATANITGLTLGAQGYKITGT